MASEWYRHSLPVQALPRDEALHGPPARRIGAVVVALVQRAVLARRRDGHHVVALDDHLAALRHHDARVRGLRNRKGERDDLAGLDRADLGVAALELDAAFVGRLAEAGLLALDADAHLLRLDPLGDAHGQFDRLLDSYIDLAGVRNVAVHVGPLRGPVEEQVHLHFAVLVVEDVLPDVVEAASAVLGAAVGPGEAPVVGPRRAAERADRALPHPFARIERGHRPCRLLGGAADHPVRAARRQL